LRGDIDYGFYEARTTFGRIGVKVWVYKGDALATRAEREAQAAATRAGAPGRGRPARAGSRPPRAGSGREPGEAQSSQPAQSLAQAAAPEQTAPVSPTVADAPSADAAATDAQSTREG
jgi:small subunit ribosomal protein S3